MDEPIKTPWTIYESIEDIPSEQTTLPLKIFILLRFAWRIFLRIVFLLNIIIPVILLLFKQISAGYCFIHIFIASIIAFILLPDFRRECLKK